MVTTKMSEAAPMTMPRAVSANRTLLTRKLSIANITISDSSIVFLELASVASNDEGEDARDGERSAGIGVLMVREGIRSDLPERPCVVDWGGTARRGGMCERLKQAVLKTALP